MKTNYILVDFENIQPKNLGMLAEHDVQLTIFVGAHQPKIPFDLAAEMQALGEKAQYQRISGSGANALDMHIAFYIGEIGARDPKAYFHIISKDKGFDPLIKHMRDRKMFAQRHSDIADIPFLRWSNATSLDDKVDEVKTYLASRGEMRPKKVEALSNTVNVVFGKTLDAAALKEIIAELEKRKHISIKDQKLRYGPAITGQ